MCYSVCGMVHIKELLLLIGKSNPCSGFLPYVRRHITVNSKIKHLLPSVLGVSSFMLCAELFPLKIYAVCTIKASTGSN